MSGTETESDVCKNADSLDGVAEFVGKIEHFNTPQKPPIVGLTIRSAQGIATAYKPRKTIRLTRQNFQHRQQLKPRDPLSGSPTRERGNRIYGRDSVVPGPTICCKWHVLPVYITFPR
jgi:hypothetical protein